MLRGLALARLGQCAEARGTARQPERHRPDRTIWRRRPPWRSDAASSRWATPTVADLAFAQIDREHGFRPPDGGAVPAGPRPPDDGAVRGGTGAHAGGARPARPERSAAGARRARADGDEAWRWPTRCSPRTTRRSRGTAVVVTSARRIRGRRRRWSDGSRRDPRLTAGAPGPPAVRRRAPPGERRQRSRRGAGFEETARLPAAGESGERARLQLLRLRARSGADARRPRRARRLARRPGRPDERLPRRTRGCSRPRSPASASCRTRRRPPCRGAISASFSAPKPRATRWGRRCSPRPLPPPGGRLAGLALRAEGVARGRAARSHRADASRARLDSLYADSPYLAIARGEDAPAYRVLEDSLEAYAATQMVARPARPGQPRRPAPARDRRVEPPGPATPSPTDAASEGARRAAPPRAVSVGPGDLSRTVFGRTFQNPLLLAAGTAGFGRELDGVMDLDRLGGLVTKAVSLAPRAGNPPPRVAEFRGGMLNSVGLANPGLERVRATSSCPGWRGTLTRAQVLVNVVGFTVEEYAEVVGGLDGVPGIAAFELNLSCPNTSAGGIEFGADPECVRRIVAGCRARTRLPLSAKLSPVLPDIAGHGAGGAGRGGRRHQRGQYAARPPLCRVGGRAPAGQRQRRRERARCSCRWACWRSRGWSSGPAGCR